MAVAPPPWAGSVYGLELELSSELRSPRRYRMLPATPSAWRDLNLVLLSATRTADVIRVLNQAGGKLLESVDVVSEFRAPELGDDRRAVQYRLTFRAPDRTVRDEEIDPLVGRLLKAVEKELDARLRTS